MFIRGSDCALALQEANELVNDTVLEKLMFSVIIPQLAVFEYLHVQLQMQALPREPVHTATMQRLRCCF